MVKPLPKISLRPFYIAGDEPAAKQKIFVAALELFVKDGLCETSIRDIASATGFTNPALFKHFAGKEALAKYLFERCYLELFRLVRDVVQSGSSFQTRQRALIEDYLAALDRDPYSVLFVQDWLRHFWPKLPIDIRRHSILGQIRILLMSGRDEGKVTTKIDVGLLITAWIGLLQQFARGLYFGEFQKNSKQLAEQLDQLLGALVRDS